MKKFSTIEITFVNSHTAIWNVDEWDDYAYDGKVLVIKKDGAWVGIYNMDSVISVVVK